jgi:hypothetical protein
MQWGMGYNCDGAGAGAGEAAILTTFYVLNAHNNYLTLIGCINRLFCVCFYLATTTKMSLLF